MAQDLLADDRFSHAVAELGGYVAVDYTPLGLTLFGADEMVEAGERALPLAAQGFFDARASATATRRMKLVRNVTINGSVAVPMIRRLEFRRTYRPGGDGTRVPDRVWAFKVAPSIPPV